MKFAVTTRFLFAALMALAAQPALHADSRPNILFMFTDDQADWTVGAYGNPDAHTPHLDQLASQGAMLTNALVVTPVCSPSRAELITSRYGTEVGITDFIVKAGHTRLPAELDVGLTDAWVTFPDLFQEAGYDTGLIGKWHLGAAPEHHPTRHGYRYFAGFVDGGTTVANPKLEVAGTEKQFNGLTVDVLTDLAVGYLRDRRKPDAPFLLSVHYRSPHAPWTPVADEDAQPYNGRELSIPNPDYLNLDTPRVKRMMREYLASVTGVDRNVGRLLDELDHLRLARDTIVIFTADHGMNIGHNGIWHKGNGIWVTKPLPPKQPDILQKYRPNLYDRSLRVPALVRWPGVVTPGSRIDHLATNLDWFPTLLAMAGIKPPPGILLRGRDLTPLLRGESIPWSDEFYGEYPMHHYALADMRCLRTPDWKLIVDFHNRNRDELYDLKRDPAESENLIRSERPDAVDARKRLLPRLLDRKRKIAETATATSQQPTDRPNIVFILADDLGARDLGSYGGKFFDTPRLDRFAAQGMRFTDAYAPAPICSASRASILTGRTPARLHFEFVTKPAGVRPPVRKLVPPPYTRDLPLKEVTIAERLGPAGYVTGFFGKWHVNEHYRRYLGWSPTHGPKQQGFADAVETFGSHPYAGADNLPDPASIPAGQFPRDGLTDEAVAFLERHASEQFFLYLSHFYVHTPVKAPASWLYEKYAARSDDSGGPADKRAHYGAFVETLDHNVGRILDTLDRLHLADNTLVVFTSDNGGHPEYAANAPFRGSKWNLYEGGIRVPFIARWPGHVPPGSECSQPVTGTDLLPTFCELARAGASAVPLDGRSLVPLFENANADWPQRSLVWHFPYYHPEKGYPKAKNNVGTNDFAVSKTHPQSALRRGDWKLIHFYDDDRDELYNLARDPGEQTNLAPTRPQLHTTLRHELDRRLKEMRARFPQTKPDPVQNR